MIINDYEHIYRSYYIQLLLKLSQEDDSLNFEKINSLPSMYSDKSGG